MICVSTKFHLTPSLVDCFRGNVHVSSCRSNKNVTWSFITISNWQATKHTIAYKLSLLLGLAQKTRRKKESGHVCIYTNHNDKISSWHNSQLPQNKHTHTLNARSSWPCVALPRGNTEPLCPCKVKCGVTELVTGWQCQASELAAHWETQHLAHFHYIPTQPFVLHTLNLYVIGVMIRDAMCFVLPRIFITSIAWGYVMI